MNKRILSLMEQRFSTFSKGQKAIARYIMDSCEQAAFLTAGRMAKAAGVSESTVVRFALELGYDGYPAMQRELQALVLDKLTPEGERLPGRQEARDVLTRAMMTDVERIQRTLANLNRDAFQAAVDATIRARRIFIVASRSSVVLGEYTELCLNRMFRNVHRVSGGSAGEMCEELLGITSEDVVLTFSFPKYATTTVACMDFCMIRNARIVAFTDRADSPIGKRATYLLTAEWGDSPVLGALSAPMSLLTGFISAIAARRSGELAVLAGSLEEIWKQYHVYEYTKEEAT